MAVFQRKISFFIVRKHYYDFFQFFFKNYLILLLPFVKFFVKKN